MKISRRNFNTKLTQSVLGVTMLSVDTSFGFSLKNQQDTKKLGVALVGLGGYSGGQLAPALVDTQHCYLAGIVTGTPSKEKVWMEKYNIPRENVYNYENFDDIANNDAIDIVYVVLPNSMHAEFCIRAAKAGKHVICEKPMAISVAECDAIIDACKAAGVKLGMGYRLQSEPYTKELKRFAKEKPYGDIHYVSCEAGYISEGNPTAWRLNHALSGGGALMNMGVYAMQGCIYGAENNPISVSAQEFSTKPEYFKDTDETITAQFLFPDNVVGHMFTSHNAAANRVFVNYKRGWAELRPATSYGPLSGSTSDGKIIKFPHESQQKLQMDDFAKHILTGSTHFAPGEMGKRDMIIVEAIYKSIKEGGKSIPLDLGDMGIVRV